MRTRLVIRFVVALLLLAHAGASAAPEPDQAARVPKFKLKSLDGRQVTLDSLKGKVVVINFWGIWCALCHKEMPDVQKLYERYAGDPGVAILTINTDENPGDVPPWMKERGYSFPVLLDNGYVTKAGLEVFPTTWVLDGDGRKVFEKRGFAEKLLDEFTARVEEIRALTPARTTGQT